MSFIKLVNVSKSFDENAILKNINIAIEQGQIISLLGSSGCGKSTTLKIIAGVLSLDRGEVYLGDVNVCNIPLGKRDVAIVFQEHLLFPHLNVFENIEFGLKMKKINKAERKKKVAKLLELVRLEGLGNKLPSELSGGQKQRVAIARTLAIDPKVLLLDEPFANLDINLRNEMREFVLELQRKLNITTILVTHDKEEALMMSDKIAVMIDGEIKQYDTPYKLYESPISKEVANIFGERNYIKGNIKNNKFISENLPYIIDIKHSNYVNIITEGNVEAMIPKESIIINSINEGEGINGMIIKKQYSGDKTYYDLEINDILLKSSSLYNEFDIGDKVNFHIDSKKIVYFEIK